MTKTELQIKSDVKSSIIREWTIDEVNDFLSIIETINGGMGVVLNPYGNGLKIPSFDPVCVGNRIIMSANPIQFLLRPDIKNITSCHSLADDPVILAGNLSYLSNAKWGNLWITTNRGKAMLYRAADKYQLFLDKYPCRNVLSSVNYLVDDDSKTVYFSRIYGDESEIENNKLLITKIFEDLGYAIGAVYPYEIPGMFDLNDRKNISVVSELQIVFSKGNQHYGFAKSADITDATYFNNEGKLVSLEQHNAYSSTLKASTFDFSKKRVAGSINLLYEKDYRNKCANSNCNAKFVKSETFGLCDKCAPLFDWSTDICEFLSPHLMAQYGLTFELFTDDNGLIYFEPIILLDKTQKSGKYIFKLPNHDKNVVVRIAIPHSEMTLHTESKHRVDKNGKPRHKFSAIARAFIRDVFNACPVDNDSSVKEVIEKDQR